MIELMLQDLADLSATQRHELLLAPQTRCQELEAQMAELAQAQESHFFMPTATIRQYQINQLGQTVTQSPITSNVLHIPVHLHPAKLEGAGRLPALTRATEVTAATTTPTTDQILLLLQLSRSIKRL